MNSLFFIISLTFSSCYVTEFFPFQKTITTSEAVNGTTIFTHENIHKHYSVDEILKQKQKSVHVKGSSHNPFDSLPIFKGSIHPEEELSWENYCFKNNTVSVEFVEEKGYQLKIEASNPKNWYCQDWYILMTSEDMSFNIINSKVFN